MIAVLLAAQKAEAVVDADQAAAEIGVAVVVDKTAVDDGFVDKNAAGREIAAAAADCIAVVATAAVDKEAAAENFVAETVAAADAGTVETAANDAAVGAAAAAAVALKAVADCNNIATFDYTIGCSASHALHYPVLADAKMHHLVAEYFAKARRY